MTPGARAQAAVELVDLIVAAALAGGAAADTVIARWFAARRWAGAKDRRAVRELAFRAIRRAGEAPASGRAALVALADDDPALTAAFDGGRHAPAPIDPAEPRSPAGPAPAWLADALRGAGLGDADLAALVGRAPLDVRVNTLRGTRADALALLPAAALTPHSPLGLRLPAGARVEDGAAWADGLVEVQDEGSQLCGLAVGALPEQRVVDLCAGGGGKTLLLAAMMAGRGELLACDVDRARLARLGPRAHRAGAALIAARLLDPGREEALLADWHNQADAVLVDAPCSGTGTWRRNPEARWRLTPARLAGYARQQARVLAVGAALVRPGGTLTYVVCSLLDVEGAGQVAAFLAERPGWRAEPPALPAGQAHRPGWRLTPLADGTDGFFVARLRAPC